jgi:hypothetical protein
VWTSVFGSDDDGAGSLGLGAVGAVGAGSWATVVVGRGRSGFFAVVVAVGSVGLVVAGSGAFVVDGSCVTVVVGFGASGFLAVVVGAGSGFFVVGVVSTGAGLAVVVGAGSLWNVGMNPPPVAALAAAVVPATMPTVIPRLRTILVTCT